MRVDQGLHLTSLGSNGPGGRSSASERDIYDVATVVIREHAECAANTASLWVDLMCERGERDGHVVWRQIPWMVEEIQHRSMHNGDTTDGQGFASNVPRHFTGIDDGLEHTIRHAVSAPRERDECDFWGKPKKPYWRFGMPRRIQPFRMRCRLWR